MNDNKSLREFQSPSEDQTIAESSSSQVLNSRKFACEWRPEPWREGGRAARSSGRVRAMRVVPRHHCYGGAIRADLGPTHAASGASPAFTPLTLLLTLHPTTFYAEGEEEGGIIHVILKFTRMGRGKPGWNGMGPICVKTIWLE